MKLRNLLFVFVLLVASCARSTVTPVAGPTVTSAPPTPVAHTTSVTDVRPAVEAYLKAWQSEDYEAMYTMLAPASQDATPKEGFIQRYKDVALATTLTSLDYEVLSVLTNVRSAQVAYRVTYNTLLLGQIKPREMTMNFSLEKDGWRVMWDDGMIMPELRGGNKLQLEYKIPARGNIYDQDGYAIANTTDVVSLGVIPDQINEDQENTLLSELSRLTGKPAEWIRASYTDTGGSWYVAVGETTADQFNARYDIISNLSGVQWKPYTARYYFDNGIAPHVVGYTQFISPELLEEYQRKGYRGDEKIGMSGLEKWGESYLAGTPGVSLYVTDPQGSILTRLGQAEVVPAQSLYTTIDANLQIEAQKAINSFRGAIVVMERDTGRVLAMVSSPGYDTNLFEPENLNFQVLGNVLNDGRNRLLNRAAQGGGYPLGSVFKIVTMAAALESGAFKPEDEYECTHLFTDLAGYELEDWTLAKGLPESGLLTLPEGLMRSCNPWFYHIGLEMYRAGLGDKIPEMARAFGFGSPTGIDQVDESSGNIPDAVSDEVTVLMAIGQDKVLVTPLQVARMIAALGNGGTLYRPQVVEKITDPDGVEVYSFKPEEQGKLPISQNTLDVIRAAMRRVVADRRGTAVQVFGGMSVPIYGKTGTAQNDAPGYPHAWFAAFTDAGRENRPDIAVAVIAEYAGEGSEIAAPIARRIIEVYFNGQPQRLYSWEARLNVTRTPIPTATNTPEFVPPTETPTPGPEEPTPTPSE
jgi:penicillin-binding protein 2